MGYWFHKKCCKLKRTVTFKWLVEQEENCVGIHVFMRPYYDNLNQVHSIFNSKVIILPNNCKHYLEVQRPLIFKCEWYENQTFKLLGLNEDFPKLT